MPQFITYSWRIALAGFVTTGVLAGGGYLPQLGPPGLRVKEKRVLLNPAEVLPPLRMDDEPVREVPEMEETAWELIGPPAPAEAAAQVQPLQADPFLMGPMQEQGGGPDREPSQIPLTPQMFMRFFNQSGNREALIQAPLEFTPPTRPAGSSATYIVK